MVMVKKEKLFLRRFFGSRLFLVIALVIVAFVAFGFARAYYQNYRVKQEIFSLQEQVRGLEHKKLESMEILKYVTSDQYAEEKARSELNLKKAGENVVIFDNLTEITTNTALTIPVEKDLLNNPIKWWYYFTHRQIIN
jgi:cell division protein FtsL